MLSKLSQNVTQQISITQMQSNVPFKTPRTSEKLLFSVVFRVGEKENLIWNWLINNLLTDQAPTQNTMSIIFDFYWGKYESSLKNAKIFIYIWIKDILEKYSHNLHLKEMFSPVFSAISYCIILVNSGRCGSSETKQKDFLHFLLRTKDTKEKINLRENFSNIFSEH